jgi:8-oxo-dGTP pyrophosphatase MutT (NUDIX family)
MLVTSRETRRWIIPKGWPQKGKPPHDSAAREAYEEAGVVGAVARCPVGSFAYEKRFKNGRVVVCEVYVFPLKVKDKGRNGQNDANVRSSGCLHHRRRTR